MLICLALTWFSDCLMIFYLTLNLDSTSLRRNVFGCKHITQGIKDFDFIKLLVPPRWRPGTPKFKFCPKSMIEKTLRKIPPLLEPLDVTERVLDGVSGKFVGISKHPRWRPHRLHFHLFFPELRTIFGSRWKRNQMMTLY